MKKILHVISSPNGTESYSVKLGNEIVKQLQHTFDKNELIEINLSKEPFPHLFDRQIKALRTPSDLLLAEDQVLVERSDKAIAQLVQSDIIVIGVPLFNFGIPSTLKSWLDNIMRAGHTFKYGNDGPKGLLTGKKVYIALASGGVYSDGPNQNFDFATPYLKTVLGFIGITDVTVVRVEGTAMLNLKEIALEKAVESIVI